MVSAKRIRQAKISFSSLCITPSHFIIATDHYGVIFLKITLSQHYIPNSLVRSAIMCPCFQEISPFRNNESSLGFQFSLKSLFPIPTVVSQQHKKVLHQFIQKHVLLEVCWLSCRQSKSSLTGRTKELISFFLTFGGSEQGRFIKRNPFSCMSSTSAFKIIISKQKVF